jgi:hypothetical protein
VAGWWSTAWPFLTGVLLGWAVVALTRRPGGSVRAGLVIWGATVIGGLLLRLVLTRAPLPRSWAWPPWSSGSCWSAHQSRSWGAVAFAIRAQKGL